MAVLFTAALPEETAALASRAAVLHTGAGKVQAATALATHLAAHGSAVDLVVNVGTAGALDGRVVGEVAEVAEVRQHDFDHEALSALAGRTLPGGPLCCDAAADATARLATGDQFISHPDERRRLAAHADLVDMEGYAVVATCRSFGVPVRCAKCVSDAADDDAARTWQETLALAAQRLGAWADAEGLLDRVPR